MTKNVNQHQPAELRKQILISNGIAAGMLFVLFVITFFFNWIIAGGILSTAPIFSILMLVFSLIIPLVSHSKPFWIAVAWFGYAVVSWVLTAPLVSLLDNALVRADPEIHVFGELQFNAALWSWALIPLTVYVVVGIVRMKRMTLPDK